METSTLDILQKAERGMSTCLSGRAWRHVAASTEIFANGEAGLGRGGDVADVASSGARGSRY